MKSKKDFPRKLQSSIFFKILWVIAITGILIYAIIIGFFKAVYVKEASNPFHTHLYQYVNYIADDIGNPPDTAKVSLISKRLSIHIQIFSDRQLLYSSLPSLPNFLFSDDQQWWKVENTFKMGEVENYFVIQTQRFQYTYIFSPQNNKLFQPNWTYVFILIAALSLVLFLAFVSIRKILRPIKNLVVGVNEISKGNLDYKLPSHHFHKKHDEFDAISGSFNQMTQRIREMIKSRDQLLLDVSHELRSPLTRMKVALEFLTDDKIRKNISEDISEMEAMVTEILESERLKSNHGGLKLNDANIIQIISDSRMQSGKSEMIQLQNLPEELILKMDSDRIKMVFKNVIENSLKYSPDSNVPIEISYMNENGYFIFKIQDHGIGIPAEELPFIFEPFYRVDKSRSKETGGFGLGMSLCKSIMEAHGGNIEIESETGKGTTVYLKFKS